MRHENNHNVVYHYGMGHISRLEGKGSNNSLREEFRQYFGRIFSGFRAR